MFIDNSPPRLTWDEAQAVLEKHVHSVVADNDKSIALAVDIAKESDRTNEAARYVTREWLDNAKEARNQSRELLAALNTMMRGV